MNAQALYQLLAAQLPETPNLTVIQNLEPCPENWPLLIQALHYERKRVTGFYVADGDANRVFCQCMLPDLADKLLKLGEGAIIHLRGATPRYFERNGAYGLEVDDVMTLKEYDAELKHQAKREAKREARIRAQLKAEGLIKDAEEA